MKMEKEIGWVEVVHKNSSFSVTDSLQAIVLEDGTTAYLATQPPGAAGVLENRTLETTTLTLDQLTSQANVQGVLTPASVVSMDATSSESEVK